MPKLKILYIANEIHPFTPESPQSQELHATAQDLQKMGMEVRILVPRFGLIHERKNGLHEVVRLSGINISIGDDEKPLTIKVAPIPQTRLQTYFIDNDSYFQRKHLLFDDQDNFFEDNPDRSIFFCKGVLETLRRLGWAPDIIHCHGWISALVPLYAKTTYLNEPVFHRSKCILSVDHTSSFSYPINSDQLREKVKMSNIKDEMLLPLQSKNSSSFIEIGAQYADLVVATRSDDHQFASSFTESSKLSFLKSSAEQSLSVLYHEIYQSLTKQTQVATTEYSII